MQDDSSNSQAGTRVPFKQEGWGVASFVVLLAVAAAASAAYVHNATYKEPQDVRFHAAGSTHKAE